MLYTALFDPHQQLQHEAHSSVSALKVASLSDTDSDAWLSLSDQEFQSEMDSRVKNFTPSDQGASFSSPQNPRRRKIHKRR